MTAMNPQMLNQYVMQALNLQPEDIQANRNGTISPRQEANFQQLNTRGKQALGRYLLILPLIIGGVLIREIVVRDNNPFASLMNQFSPILLIPIGIMLLWVMAMAVMMMRGNGTLNRKRVQIVEGPAKLDIAGEGNYQTQAVIAATGMDPMRGRLKIGGKTFHLSENVLRAFQPGTTYRVYYVKFGALPLLISAEAL